MYDILIKDNDYQLEIERIQGKYWLTLRHIASGNCQIIISGQPKADSYRLFEGKTIPEIKAYMDNWHVPVQKIYDIERAKP